jgi:hypothetical protein
MQNKSLLMISTILLASSIQQAYSMQFFKDLGHAVIAGAQLATLNKEEENQLQNTVMPALNAHAFVTHHLEKNQQNTERRMQSSPDVIALIPACCIALKIFSKVAKKDVAAAALLASTFGTITWLAGREWIKKAPQQAANINPFVFIPRCTLWIYERLTAHAFRQQQISPNALTFADHSLKSNLVKFDIPEFDIWRGEIITKEIPTPERTKKFAHKLAKYTNQ